MMDERDATIFDQALHSEKKEHPHPRGRPKNLALGTKVIRTGRAEATTARELAFSAARFCTRDDQPHGVCKVLVENGKRLDEPRIVDPKDRNLRRGQHEPVPSPER